MKRGFSLLETLFAAALLAVVTLACLPLARSGVPRPVVTPDPRLAALARANDPPTPPNASIDRFASSAGRETDGSWVVVEVGDRFTVVWAPAKAVVTEGEP